MGGAGHDLKVDRAGENTIGLAPKLRWRFGRDRKAVLDLPKSVDPSFSNVLAIPMVKRMLGIGSFDFPPAYVGECYPTCTSAVCAKPIGMRLDNRLSPLPSRRLDPSPIRRAFSTADNPGKMHDAGKPPSVGLLASPNKWLGGLLPAIKQ